MFNLNHRYYSFWASPLPHHNDSESTAGDILHHDLHCRQARLLEAEEQLGLFWASPSLPPHHNGHGSRSGNILYHDTVEPTPQTNQGFLRASSDLGFQTHDQGAPKHLQGVTTLLGQPPRWWQISIIISAALAKDQVNSTIEANVTRTSWIVLQWGEKDMDRLKLK